MDRKRVVFVLVSILVLLGLILSLFAVSRGNLSNSEPVIGRVVYQNDQRGTKEIYILDLETMESIRVTNNSWEDYSPAYAAAFERVAYVSDREDGTNLYTANLDGSDEKAVFPQSMMLDYPDWSPDGNSIVVSYTPGCTEDAPCNFDLHRFDLPEGVTMQLTDTPESEWVPQWSPDGTKIAFASDRDGDSEIYVMDADGSNLVQLTDNGGYDGRPRWSPDGKSLSFETDRGGGNWNIWLMNADGSRPRAVTPDESGNNWMQFWSPDGNWLVFVSDRDGNSELYIININSREQQRLTDSDSADEAPVWIP